MITCLQNGTGTRELDSRRQPRFLSNAIQLANKSSVSCVTTSRDSKRRLIVGQRWLPNPQARMVWSGSPPTTYVTISTNSEKKL